jgi:outer membrane protein TolC
MTRCFAGGTSGRVTTGSRAAAAAATLLLAAAAPLGAQTPTLQPGAERPVVTLQDAIRLSERVQPRVVQAETSVRSAEARARTATLGAYLPSVSFNASGANSRQGESPTQPAFSGNNVSTGVSASLDLFTGFRRGAESRAARASESAAEATLVDARFQQSLATTTTFFDALAAQQLVSVRQAGVRRAEEQLKISVNKLHAGSATRSDSLRSLVELGNARLQLIQAQTQLASAEAELGRLVGADGRVAAADDSSFYRAPAVDTAALRAEVLERSPQVRSAAANAAAAAATERAARAAYWPSLTLNGSYGYNGNDRGETDLFDLSSNRQVSLRLSWNLFNGFEREQQIAVQSAQADLAQAEAADARRQVQAGVTAALAELEAARAAIEISQTSVVAAQEDLRVVQERYRLGASTIVDVLTSQEALNQAEVDAVNARFDFLRAKARLDALIGRTL